MGRSCRCAVRFVRQRTDFYRLPPPTTYTNMPTLLLTRQFFLLQVFLNMDDSSARGRCSFTLPSCTTAFPCRHSPCYTTCFSTYLLPVWLLVSRTCMPFPGVATRAGVCTARRLSLCLPLRAPHLPTCCYQHSAVFGCGRSARNGYSLPHAFALSRDRAFMVHNASPADVKRAAPAINILRWTLRLYAGGSSGLRACALALRPRRATPLPAVPV